MHMKMREVTQAHEEISFPHLLPLQLLLVGAASWEKTWLPGKSVRQASSGIQALPLTSVLLLKSQKRVRGGMVREGDLTLGGDHTIRYTGDVLQNCTPETYLIVFTNAIPKKSIKIKILKIILQARLLSMTQECHLVIVQALEEHRGVTSS